MRLLMAVLGLCLLPLAACSDDEELLVDGSPSATDASTKAASPSPGAPSTTPTPVPTASASAQFSAFRQFADQVQAALDAGDTAFFLDDAVVSSMECPNALTDCGVPYPTVIQGILVGLWQSEGGVLPVDEFRVDLEQYLESRPQIRAVAGLYHDYGGALGGPAFFAVVTTPQAPEMTAKGLQFVNDGGRWRFRLYLNTGRADTDNEWVSGTCAECYDYWEPWQE